MSKKGNGGFSMLGFMFGSLVGTVVGILIAPKPGSETRVELAEQSEIWKSRAEEFASILKEGLTPVVEEFKDVMQPVVENLNNQINKQKSTDIEIIDNQVDLFSEIEDIGIDTKKDQTKAI
ncbi:MAG: hypothetical protein CL758_08750 [Chloroflexi bacterium]|nr:hypothetical protein [Chloroflexota bacterium]|tara:strand:- start:965 stop:1327 length:363 start_codon:yes stop_codon:yes gene_type:complete